MLLSDVNDINVTRLGIDEHRYRSVKWFRNPAGGWRRFEPWMTTLVNIDTSQVLGVVDGRHSASVGRWLSERSEAWRERAAVSVDKFHLVKLGNDTLTAVRQRLTREQYGRRGHKTDTVWAHRMLLLRGADTLSPRGWARLEEVFRRDDPTDELGAAWGIKEQLRRLLNPEPRPGVGSPDADGLLHPDRGHGRGHQAL